MKDEKAMTGAYFPGLGEHTWLSENGIELKTRELRPIVDEPTERLYAFTPRGDVVLLKEYEHYRNGCTFRSTRIGNSDFSDMKDLQA